MGKFQEELEKARAAKAAGERPSIGEQMIAQYGDGSKAHDWYKSKPPAAKSDIPDFAKIDVAALPEFERSPADEKLDAFLQVLTITQAYQRWIPKGKPERRYVGQTESIMIRCPFPHHLDEVASAWCNSEKNVWYCGKCSYGGDVYDFAAIHYGYPVPEYKRNPGQFKALRAEMAKSFGIEIVRGVNGDEYAVTAQDATTALPSQGVQPVPAPRKAEEPQRHKGFQIPGVRSIKIPMPGQAAPQATIPTPPPVAPAPPAPATVHPAPPMPPPPPPPPVAVQAPVPEVTPKESDEASVEVAEVATGEVQTPPAAPSQLHAGFRIPGVAKINMGGSGAAFGPTMQVPPPTIPPVTNLAPSPAMAVQITTPTESLLAQYGLTPDGDDTGDGGYRGGIYLPWRDIIEPGTFLHDYMSVVTQDEAPEEFHIFCGMAALGLAVGRDLLLKDKIPVKANSYICLLGETGEGKSNAKKHMVRLVSKALPFDIDDPGNKGVRRVSNPSSGEFLVREFMKTLKDPLSNAPIGGAPVRGIVDFEEFATLMNRASNKGASLAQFLIEMFDGQEEVNTGSITNNKFVATEPFATTISTTQPRVLRDLVSDRHIADGFLNRWIFVTGQPKEIIPLGGEVIEIDPVIPSLQSVWGWAGMQTGMIEWEQAAFLEAYNFLKDVVLPTRKLDRTGVTARIDLMYKKLIMLLTINLKRPKVPLEAVLYANKIYYYLVQTYGILDQAVNQSIDEDLRQEVMKAILTVHKKNNRPPSLKELSDKVGTRRYSLDQIHRCVQVLHKMGHVEEIPPPPGPGRKTVRFQIITSD
ncbi:hypothetical protein AB0F25_30450 [Streptomyces wedmorensis]|uniref:hypothetical protein n=1 Tax=Streptomyces wedmorensis TaxID=43759 RepID=UPI0034349B2A